MPLFPTADFQEREVYDFFGIVFRGHPDLRRILLPEVYVGWPQRRDFPIGGEPVIFTHNEHQVPGWSRVSEATCTSTAARPAHGGDVIAATAATVIGTSPIERTEAGDVLEPEHELLTVNMGPHHPATHGVLRLLVSLQGEEVLDLKPIVGYVHTGIEKSCEDKSYWKVIPFVERMDYLSYFFNMQAFCGAVETLLELEIPPRAKYLRTIHLELNRIHSHLFWLGTTALDLGAVSMLWYALRERDTILDLFEMSTGQRMHTRYFQVGGVFEDIPVGFEQKLRAFCDEMPDPDRPVRGAARPQRDLPPADQGRRDRPPRAPARARRHRPAAARRRRALGPAQGRPLPRLRRRRLQDPGRHGRRRLRPLPRAGCRRCASRCGSSSSASTGCPRGRGSPTTARSCCRRATSSRPRWRR